MIQDSNWKAKGLVQLWENCQADCWAGEQLFAWQQDDGELQQRGLQGEMHKKWPGWEQAVFDNIPTGGF